MNYFSRVERLSFSVPTDDIHTCYYNLRENKDKVVSVIKKIFSIYLKIIFVFLIFYLWKNSQNFTKDTKKLDVFLLIIELDYMKPVYTNPNT